MQHKVVNDKVHIEHRGDGIFRYSFARKADIDIETAKAMVRAGDQMAEDITLCVNLVDTREMLFINSEARKYLALQKRDNLAAIAILINSKFQRSLANLYFKFTIQATPTKLFTDEYEAEQWLVQELESIRQKA